MDFKGIATTPFSQPPPSSVAGPSRSSHLSAIPSAPSIDLTGEEDTSARPYLSSNDIERTSLSPSNSKSKLGPSSSTLYPGTSQHFHPSPSLSSSHANTLYPSHHFPPHLGSPSGAPRSRAEEDIQVTGANITSPRPKMYDPQQLSSSAAPPGGMTIGSLAMGSLATNGARSSNGESSRGPRPHGASADSAIDLTQVRLPSPPPVAENKRPVCIGAVQSRAILLYPSAAAVVGAPPPPGSKEKFSTVMYMGAELLKVKLKLRTPQMRPRPDEPWSSVTRHVIQIMTPGMSSYIGDLEPTLADQLIPHVNRGILRLEGFAQRLHPDAPQYEVRLNVLLFTLPSNIAYISQSLTANNIYLLDPVPPYDPARHAENPPYMNAHGSGENALRMMLAAQRKAYGSVNYSMTVGQMDKVKAVEVQRQQVDEVFKSLESGGDLEQSDPGPFIKTELFPHQRKALTFLLQREQDFSSLKTARKYFTKKELKRKKKAKSGEEEANGTEEVSEEQKSKDKMDARSLWEGREDDRGRTRVWVHKITQDVYKSKKGERPGESKGAILADDMGLGKTLSVVSLISSTRSAAAKWARTKLEQTEFTTEVDEILKNGLKASEMATKIYGMPKDDSDDETSLVRGKKRKQETPKNLDARRARIIKRSKGTLLVCPMSTITNWEDQIKEHWNGRVEIVGGASGLMPPKKFVKKWKPPKKDGETSSDEDEEEFDTLKVYIYHGSARRPDPEYLSTFDIVITSYNTLALEFSKQNNCGDGTPTTPGETAGNSDEDSSLLLGDTSLNGRPTKPEVEAEIKAQEVADALLRKKKKGKATAKVGVEQTSPLQALDWFRVVLDEAHYIKTATTVASQASCDLEADRRIALTGTPIQNKIEDVWALFKFLRLSPIDEKDVFTKYISSPCKYGEQIGVARLQLTMRCCTLRRTKDTTAEDGRRILNLPPKQERQLWLDLRDDEREIYKARQDVVKEKVDELRRTKQLSKNYANVLHEILVLRQCCDHVDLADNGLVEEDYDGTLMDYQVAIKGIQDHGLNQPRAISVLSYLKEGDGAICQGCTVDYSDHFPSMGLDGLEEGDERAKLDEKRKKVPANRRPILTKCLHVFCPPCFKHQVYSDYSKRMKEVATRSCTCGALLRLPTDAIDVIPPDSDEKDKEKDTEEKEKKRYTRKKYVRKPGEKPNLSTKMQFLHDELLKYSRRNPHSENYNPFEMMDGAEEVDAEGKPYVTKSVVFSQWTTMLDRIGDMLDEARIRYSRLDGTMTREERAKAMDDLRTKKKTEVLLVSTRAGGVGLNLTAASRCYLVDPYWNPSVESQAIDRIHRMGQTRPVVAIKLMINDSIETKLDKIQKKKADLANVSLSTMSRKELMEKKAEELADLFS